MIFLRDRAEDVFRICLPSMNKNLNKYLHKEILKKHFRVW